MRTRSQSFATAWIVIFTMEVSPGEIPQPRQLAATNCDTHEVLQLELPALRQVNHPPYPINADCLVITIDGPAIAGAHLHLGWPSPERMIDLMVEFKNVANGHPSPLVGGLPGALLWFGKSTAGATGAILSADQLQCRLNAVSNLFQAMRPHLDFGRALLRGRYLIAAAAIEANGVPVDLDMIQRLRIKWPAIRGHVISTVDRDFGFYSGRGFDLQTFTRWVAHRSIPWPRLTSGQLDLGNDAFKAMARIDPDLVSVKELRATLTSFDPFMLALGGNGRNRAPLRSFASSTGRNQPSAKASILGSAKWVRHLIKPQAGTAIAYIDWQQQEFGIAAALSDDGAMQSAYLSGDPYIGMAIAAKALPQGATALSHARERAQFKACAIGVQYGMGAATLARQLNWPEHRAVSLLETHRKTFPRFWSWSDSIENQALLRRELVSTFGWRLAVGADANPRSLRNFPMQANGAEMLRLACCLTTENGISVCAPNHDALLIEAPIDEIDRAVGRTQQFMAEASGTVLDGFELRTDVRIIRAPDRWTEQSGQSIWSAVQKALRPQTEPAHERDTSCSPANSRTVLLYVSKEDSSDASD